MATIRHIGTLEGHRGWVTAIACPAVQDSETKLVTASRDNTVVAWKSVERHSVEEAMAIPERRLEGHSNFVSDVAVSGDGSFAVSSSWDRSLRLCNLKTGETRAKMLGHTHDVTSVAFSPDNRQIISGSRDGKIRMWNINGECMFISERESHSDWVNCVRFSPAATNSVIVSGSSDGTVKVWKTTDMTCLHTLKGHTGAVFSVAVSPDGSLCASGGKDGKAKLWDLNSGEHLYELDCGDVINQICFSPSRYWLCAATDKCVRIHNLQTKEKVADLCPPVKEASGDEKTSAKVPACLSIAWSADGNTLYSGYTNNSVNVWFATEN